MTDRDAALEIVKARAGCSTTDTEIECLLDDSRALDPTGNTTGFYRPYFVTAFMLFTAGPEAFLKSVEQGEVVYQDLNLYSIIRGLLAAQSTCDAINPPESPWTVGELELKMRPSPRHTSGAVRGGVKRCL